MILKNLTPILFRRDLWNVKTILRTHPAKHVFILLFPRLYLTVIFIQDTMFFGFLHQTHQNHCFRRIHGSHNEPFTTANRPHESRLSIHGKVVDSTVRILSLVTLVTTPCALHRVLSFRDSLQVNSELHQTFAKQHPIRDIHSVV